MTKQIDESNAGRMRAMLEILSESVEEVTEVSEAAEAVEEEKEVAEEGEEVSEAAEFDLDEKLESKGEEYEGTASMPGKAAAKVRYTPARQGDNPMVENDLYKSFLEYLKEAEAKETEVTEAEEADEDTSEEDNSEN